MVVTVVLMHGDQCGDEGDHGWEHGERVGIQGPMKIEIPRTRAGTDTHSNSKGYLWFNSDDWQ